MDFANWFDPLLQGLTIMVRMGPRRNQWGILIMDSIKIGQDQSFFLAIYINWHKNPAPLRIDWNTVRTLTIVAFIMATGAGCPTVIQSFTSRTEHLCLMGVLWWQLQVRNFWIILVLICSDHRLSLVHVLIMLHSVVFCWYHTGTVLWCIILYCIRCYMFNDCSMYHLCDFVFVRSWVAMVYAIIWCSGRFCSILFYYIVLHVVYCNIAA